MLDVYDACNTIKERVQMVKRYTIMGDPLKAILNTRTLNYSVFPSSQYKKYRDIKERIAKQHNVRMFKGALEIEVKYYMPISGRYSLRRQEYLKGCYHSSKPSLTKLYGFTDKFLKGVVISSGSVVSKLTVSKLYTECMQSRTEITIKELELYGSKEAQAEKKKRSAELRNEDDNREESL
jgi:Holliday junction resolvase RusA-like endonuclease